MTTNQMIKFDLRRDRDVIFRRTIAAIQLAIKNNKDVAEISGVKVAETEVDAFVLKPDWIDAMEKAKNHFEKIEDYEMCQICVSLIDETKKLTN